MNPAQGQGRKPHELLSSFQTGHLSINNLDINERDRLNQKEILAMDENIPDDIETRDANHQDDIYFQGFKRQRLMDISTKGFQEKAVAVPSYVSLKDHVLNRREKILSEEPRINLSTNENIIVNNCVANEAYSAIEYNTIQHNLHKQNDMKVTASKNVEDQVTKGVKRMKEDPVHGIQWKGFDRKTVPELQQEIAKDEINSKIGKDKSKGMMRGNSDTESMSLSTASNLLMPQNDLNQFNQRGNNIALLYDQTMPEPASVVSRAGPARSAAATTSRTAGSARCAPSPASCRPRASRPRASRACCPSRCATIRSAPSAAWASTCRRRSSRRARTTGPGTRTPRPRGRATRLPRPTRRA